MTSPASTRPASRRLLHLRRLALALGAPVLALALLEGLCHLAGWGTPTRFLLAAHHGDQPVWIDNQVFGYRFFDPAVSRAPAPILVPRTKSADELRVVVLGESAAMGEPEPAYGPARQLELLLAARHPGRTVRVINAAMTAINAHVIREIARELPRLQPDIVVLYIGNNEVVGPFGPGTVFSDHAAPWWNRARVLASRLRLAGALRAAGHSIHGGDRQVWQGMEMFLEHRVAADDPRLESVRTGFDRNLGAILDAVFRSGAIPVLSTVAVNLTDQAPLDGSPAPTESSIEAWRAANEADTLRFRADAAINAIIRRHAATRPGVVLVDAEADFAARGLTGNETFIDHVHVSLDGGYHLAVTWASAIDRALPPVRAGTPTLDDIKQRLLWNPYNALDLAEIMLERAARPPFSGTADHTARMVRWTHQRAEWMAATRALPLDDLMATYRDTAERFPDDLHLPQQAARALLAGNRLHEAETWLRRLHTLIPHRADVRSWLVILEAIHGRTDNAWDTMTRDAPALGELPADLLISASETLLAAGYRAESLDLLQRTAARYPERTRLQVLLASRLAQNGQRAEAAERFEQLVRSHPGETWIAEEYGILLALDGNSAEADRLLDHLRSSPDPEQQLKWVNLLMFQRRWDEAGSTLRALADRHPNHGPVLRQLALLSQRNGDLISAIAFAERWLAVEPWQGEGWGQLGDWYDEVNRTRDAVDAYTRALPLLTEPAATRRALAWLLATASEVLDTERALALLQAVPMDTGEAQGYTHLVRAAALAASGRHGEAVAEVTRALADPANRADPALLDQLEQARALFKQGGVIRR